MASYTDPTVISVGRANKVQTGVVLTLVAGILSVLAAGFFFWVSWQTKANANEVREENTVHEQRLAQLQPVADSLERYSEQAQQFHLLFSNQIKWDEVMKVIEERMYRNMTVTSLQLTDAGTMVLSGTTPTYVDYAKIFHSLSDPSVQQYFTAARPISIARTEEKEGAPSVISFSFNVSLSPQLVKPAANSSAQ